MDHPLHEPGYRVVQRVCAVVAAAPVGTNRGRGYVRWMRVRGRLLETRGAVIPGRSVLGLADPVVRRAWAAVGHGHGRSAALRAQWPAVVERDGRGQAPRMRAIGPWRWT
jgi:hypothetical protein